MQYLYVHARFTRRSYPERRRTRIPSRGALSVRSSTQQPRRGHGVDAPPFATKLGETIGKEVSRRTRAVRAHSSHASRRGVLFSKKSDASPEFSGDETCLKKLGG